MEIPDVEVFKMMQKVAMIEPEVKRIVEAFDNGELNLKIEKAVSLGIKECPFYIEGKAKKKIVGFIKWVIMVSVSIVTTLVVIHSTVGFK